MRSVKHGGRSCHFMSAFVCGLDVYEESTYATVLNDEGEVINQMRMSNTCLSLFRNLLAESVGCSFFLCVPLFWGCFS